MNFVYTALKLFSVPRDRVLFISRHSDSAGENFLLIAEEIKKRSPHTELRFSCKKDKLGQSEFARPFLMLDRMRLLACSRVCITDSETAELGILKHRKELRIIQLWHSMAPFRKFGWQTVGTSEGVPLEYAEGVKLHSGYDYVIVGSEFAREIFAEAMNTDISKVLPLGIPITDSMIASSGESERFKLWKLHPSTCGKKIVVYAPTIRLGGSVPCSELVSSLDYENTALVVKLHPKDTETLIGDDRVVIDTEMSTQEAILAADVIITDYSGVAAEASLLGKPVFFYTPDLENYSGSCGLNIDPSALFPDLTFSDARKLADVINTQIDGDISIPIRDTLAGACRGDSTKNIANLATETSIQTVSVPSSVKSESKLKDFISRCSYTIKYLGSNIDPMLILFESKQTCSYEGNVKELYESIVSDSKFGDCRFAWAVFSPDEADIHGGVTVLVVKYGSSEHMQLHARAGIIVSDTPVSSRVRLRTEQNYLVADSSSKETIRRLIS